MEQIRQRTIVEQVMQHMKKLIADGVYTPGSKIPTEQELASEFGVGRSSIREAVKIFNYLGIMKSMSSRGTYICERSNISTELLTWALLLGNNELDEVVELRGAIELWSFIRLTSLCKNKSNEAEKHVAQLHVQLEQMRQAVVDGNHEQMIKADYEFHHHIIQGGDNDLFISLYEMLRSFMLHEIEKTQMKYSIQQKILEEHTLLVGAIESGDILLAAHTYIAHINNIKSLLKDN
jgi:DNA-binding FadR family transcriptional regulator